MQVSFQTRQDKTRQDSKGQKGTYLHCVENTAIKLLPPLLRTLSAPEFQQCQIPVHLRCHHQSAVTDVLPPLLANKAKEVACGHVRRNRRYADGRKLLILLLPILRAQGVRIDILQRWCLLPFPIE